MEEPLWNASILYAVGLIVCVRVQGVVGHNVVLENSLEVFLTVSAEEEAIDSGSKLPERKVGWSKDGTSNVIGCIVQGLQESGLGKSEFQRTELARKQINDFDSLWRRDQDAVNAVNDTIASELHYRQFCTQRTRRR